MKKILLVLASLITAQAFATDAIPKSRDVELSHFSCRTYTGAEITLLNDKFVVSEWMGLTKNYILTDSVVEKHFGNEFTRVSISDRDSMNQTAFDIYLFGSPKRNESEVLVGAIGHIGYQTQTKHKMDFDKKLPYGFYPLMSISCRVLQSRYSSN